jgi:hypothetical protein
MRYLHRWKPRGVVPVVRPVFTEALGAEDDQLADFQDLIGSAEIDRDAARKPVKAAEPPGLGKIEGIVAFVGRGEDRLIKQVRVAIAVAEPALDRGLQGKVPHAVRQQKDPAPRRLCLCEDRLQIGEKAHDVQAGLAGHRLVLLVVSGNEISFPQRRPAERDNAGIGSRNVGSGEPFAIERSASDRGLEAVVEAVDEKPAGCGPDWTDRRSPPG